MRRTIRGTIRVRSDRTTTWAATKDDADLARLLKRSPLSSMDDAVALFDEVDMRLPDDDGLKWVNQVVAARARELRIDRDRGRWTSPPWVERLELCAAQLYADAVAVGLDDPRAAPRAWGPVLVARHRSDVARARFGLAGLAAHLQRDLPLALARTAASLGRAPDDRSAEHIDFQRMTDVVTDVESAALGGMSSGLTRFIARVGDDTLPRTALAAARRVAWRRGVQLHRLGAQSVPGRAMLRAMDHIGAAATSLIV